MNRNTPEPFWSRAFGGLAASALAHPWRWLGGALLLAAASLALAAARLELKTSNLDLVDHEIPTVARFLSFAERFGSPNMLVVVLEGDAANQDRLKQAVDRLAPRLAAVPGVRTVMARLPYDRDRLADLGVPAYFTSLDGGLSFILVQPTDPTSSAATITAFVDGVRGVLAAADLPALGVRAGLTGLPQYALDDRDIIQRDVSKLSTVSFVAVGLICAIGFHAFRRPVLAMVALVFVTAYVIGFAAIIPGHLTLLSAFFFSALFGLGSDYGVYVLHGMEERLAAGEDLSRALAGSIRFIAPGLATAAFATAAAFLTLMLSGFLGFSELGFIGAVGIVLSLFATVTLLPALLAVVRDRNRGERELHERGVGRALLALQHPVLASLLGGAALFAIAGGVPRFDGDYTHLQPKHSESVRLEREMVKRSGLSPHFAAFVARDQDRAADIIVSLGEEPAVGAVRSLHDLRQLDMVALPEKAGRAALERMFRAPDGTQAIYAYPAGDVWDPSFVDEFLARMRAIDPEVTGMPVLGQFMIELSRHALIVTSIASGIVMLLIVGLDFGLTRYTLLASAPTLFGVAATLGAMRWMGVPFNPINVMAFPVIVGTGVDAGVHLTQRFLAEKGDLARTITGAGHTVFISGLTTVVGFAALAFTEHRGLASFAIVLTLGSTICLALSLLVLPLVLRGAYRSGAAARARTARAVVGLVLAALVSVTAARAGVADDAARGDAAWHARASGFAATGKVDPGPAGEAIAAYEAALAARPDDAGVRFKLCEALYFRGYFVRADDASVRRDLDRMVELAEDGVRRAPPGTPAATEAHFWAAIAWGVWGMAHGNLASAFQGVAVKIRDHAEAVRAADERYRDAAGLRLLGRLHTKVPRMPFVSGWADRGKGIELLRRAYAISRADRRNALFLGQALLTYRPKEKAEALALLREVACAPIPEAEIVEVSEQVRDAKGALREAGAPFDPAACRGSEPAP